MATAHLRPPPGPTTYFSAAILAPHCSAFFFTIFISSAGGLPLAFTMPEMLPPPTTAISLYSAAPWGARAETAAARRAVIRVRSSLMLSSLGCSRGAGLEEDVQPSH